MLTYLFVGLAMLFLAGLGVLAVLALWAFWPKGARLTLPAAVDPVGGVNEHVEAKLAEAKKYALDHVAEWVAQERADAEKARVAKIVAEVAPPKAAPPPAADLLSQLSAAGVPTPNP